jgi:hypothetical protein
MLTGLKDLSVTRGRFLTQARLTWEYAYEFTAGRVFLQDLKAQGIDLISFIERTFLESIDRQNRSSLNSRGFHTEIETVGLLSTSSYEDWLRSIGKKARQDISRSERRGVLVREVRMDDNFLRDALAIYNETPVRQGRRYTGYGVTLDGLKKKFSDSKDAEILGAYDETQLVGLLWMMLGDRVAQIGSFVHLVSKRDKLPTNALIAAAVKNCCERGIQFLVYPTAFGLQPGIDSFRLRMKFTPFAVPRRYVPLTRRGCASIRLHVHKPIQHVMPRTLARVVGPIYSYLSLSLPASVLDRVGGIE